MPKYSFVLPAYKSLFFKEALDSILAQTYKDFELIIVNDASPEDLTSIVKSYNDSRIRYYINDVNIGGQDLVAQWNLCLEYATGDYVILASDDDLYHEEFLWKMDGLVVKHPQVNVYRPRIQLINKEGDVMHIDSNYTKKHMSQLYFCFLWYNDHLSSISPYIFRKTALVDIGGFINFPSAWFSDDATVIKLCNLGIVTTNDILFSFRQSGVNITSSINNAEMLYNKLLATELFFNWFIHELNEMNCSCEEEALYIKIINSTYRYRKNDRMIWQIQQSSINIVSAWRILRKISSIRILDCIKILYRSCYKKA